MSLEFLKEPLKSGNSWFFVPRIRAQVESNKGYKAESNRSLSSAMCTVRLRCILWNQQDYPSTKSDHLRIVQIYDQQAYMMSETVAYQDIRDNISY